METNKVLYLLIGVLIGIIAILVIDKLPTQNAVAAPTRQTETVANQDFIALAAMSRSDTNILWLIDTKNRKLLLYEYFNENVIKLKLVRDIQYDIAIPDGVTIPANRKDADPQPLEVKELYDKIRKSSKEKEPKEKVIETK